VAGILSSLVMFSKAVFVHFTSGENNFFYEAFSFLIHPSYLSMYFNFLIIWLLLGLLKKGEIRSYMKPGYNLAIILFLSFINVLLSSKMGLLSMAIIFLSFGVYYIILSKKYLIGGIAIVIFITGIVLSSIYIPAIEHRVSFAIAALTKKEISIKSDESSEVRMLIWKAANGIIAEHPIFGVGTGDAKDVLMNEYANKGMTGAIGHKLNAHNEFYQITITLGFIGIIVLLANLLIPFFVSIKFKHIIYVLFILLIMFNFFPESMLETQAGVMFYAFVNSMLCFCSFGSDPEQFIKEDILNSKNNLSVI
jgi:O-antigen ligase